MEKINISKLVRENRLDADTPDAWVKWALIHGVSEAGGWDKVGVDVTTKPTDEPKPDTVLDVEFKINGVEVKFSEILVNLIKSFNNDVERTARNFVRDEVTKATSRLNEIVEEFEQRLAKVGDEFEDEMVKRGVKIPWKDE